MYRNPDKYRLMFKRPTLVRQNSLESVVSAVSVISKDNSGLNIYRKLS